jgi:hypothetical protein
MLGGYQKWHEIVNGYQGGSLRYIIRVVNLLFKEEPVPIKIRLIYPWFSKDVRADSDI